MTQVGSLLIEADLISRNDLDRALSHQQHQGGRVLGILFSLGAVTRSSMFRFLASRGMPTLNPMNYRISGDVLNLLPLDFIVKYEMLPVDRLGPMMTVVMLYPWDQEAIRSAEKLTGLRVNAFLCDADQFSTTFERLYARPLRDAAVQLDKSTNTNFPVVAESVPESAHDESNGLEALRFRISELESLPVLPSTINRLGNEAGHSNDATRAILETASEDVAAAALLLRAANELVRGDAEPIARLADAIRLLGVEQARVLILSAPALGREPRRVCEEYQRVGRESVRIASLAQHLADTCIDDSGHSPYESALLANLGRLGLIELVRRERNYERDWSHPERFLRLMEALTQANHAETGAQLATVWQLPAVFVECIRHVRTPSLARQYRKTAALVHLADAMVRCTGRVLENDCAKVLDVLGASTAGIHRALWPSAGPAQN